MRLTSDGSYMFVRRFMINLRLTSDTPSSSDTCDQKKTIPRHQKGTEARYYVGLSDARLEMSLLQRRVLPLSFSDTETFMYTAATPYM